MPVYVDYSSDRFGNMLMCHMIADTENELKNMAHRLGLKQSWRHNDHFDICKSKRSQAVKFGAIELSNKQLVLKLREIKRRRGTDEDRK